MPKGYHHLTNDQRCQLYTLMKRGDSQAVVAKILKVDKSTICRELKRNRGKKGYRFKQAHEKTVERRYKASSCRSKMTPKTISRIESKLALQWSPEQIAGWLKKTGSDQPVSYETIYQHIWRDKQKRGVLYKHLRHNGKKYNKRRSGKAGRGCIPNRIDIDQRPAIVEQKCRLGDWELDTIIGKNHKGAIVSMVDRASKLTKLVCVTKKTAENIEQALVSKLSPIQQFVFSLTADNGKEFAGHEAVSKCLGADFFFARPYHSWERGLNEHTNGLVRQYFPKSMRLDEVTQEEIENVEILLNNRPRKVLEYLTPIEAFEKLSQQSTFVALHS